MKPLEIVHLEDSEPDAELVRDQLGNNGIEAHFIRAKTEAEFRAALERPEIDVILADRVCPGFDGFVALSLARAKLPTVPFIFVAGTMNSQEAVDSLERGATDFVFKQDLAKLAPAVRRAVNEARRLHELLSVREHLSEQAKLLAQTKTAHKQIEEALRISEEGQRKLLDEGFTANFIMRPDGGFISCNPEFVRIFGFNSKEEAVETNFMSLLRSKKDGAQLLALVAQHGTVERHELEMRTLTGEALYVVARLVGTSDQHGHLTQLQGYLFNDTKRKRLEQQLVQAQKMEGLGTLAGGIAHDFNNILAIILGYTNQLEKWEKKPELIPGAVKVIKEAVERGAALVQQLLTSARQAEAHLSQLDLNGLVRELEKMLNATFPKMISFELKLEPNLPPITADRSQIHQVLLNLCVNARDAMPKGGVMILETSVASEPELAEFLTGSDARGYACLRVRDTGVGMTPDVKAHMFEPFFTTKERAKGTGLGLSVVYGVVNNHRGFVQVESEPNVGTTFSIYLPLHAISAQPDDTQSFEPRKPREPQTIMLVEDEEMLRELGIQILESEGYRVLAAKDGEEAVEIFTLHRDEVGLVVCDLGLPKLGGREVFLKMKESKPSVRAIVASGYLEPSMRSEMLKAGVIDTIQKPYDFRELVEKIQSVIGKAQSEDDHPQLF